jgi:hypothetical protein
MRTLGRTLIVIVAAALALSAAALVHRVQAARAARQSAAGQGDPGTAAMPDMAGAGAAPGSAAAAAGAAGSAAMPDMPDMPDMPGMGSGAAGAAGAAASADTAMAHPHMAMGAHMKMTPPRPRTAADQRRADAIVQTVRDAIARYRDYRVAEADGFRQFAPNIPQPMYHFTSWRNGLRAGFAFDPARPTSLLYKPVAGGGFQLVGAMYTAPRRFDLDQLDQRVPLSIASWHQHVNICLPPGWGRGAAAPAASGPAAAPQAPRFGINGSIATDAECKSNGGFFLPVVLGWMVHVYPFEQDPARVWAQ